MKTIELKIDGMHCQSCARRLEGVLARARGVEKASVSYRSRSARLVFDGEAVSAEALRLLIEDAGFSARVD